MLTALIRPHGQSALSERTLFLPLSHFCHTYSKPEPTTQPYGISLSVCIVEAWYGNFDSLLLCANCYIHTISSNRYRKKKLNSKNYKHKPQTHRRRRQQRWWRRQKTCIQADRWIEIEYFGDGKHRKCEHFQPETCSACKLTQMNSLLIFSLFFKLFISRSGEFVWNFTALRIYTIEDLQYFHFILPLHWYDFNYFCQLNSIDSKSHSKWVKLINWNMWNNFAKWLYRKNVYFFWGMLNQIGHQFRVKCMECVQKLMIDSLRHTHLLRFVCSYLSVHYG